MAFRTYSIGRGRKAEIRLRHATVSRHHAELTITSLGTYFLVDRCSLHGTWIVRDRAWTKHRQGYVKPHEAVRFGKCEVRLKDVASDSQAVGGSPADDPQSVRPLRNPNSGEIEL